jgi:hypothetical protein
VIAGPLEDHEVGSSLLAADGTAHGLGGARGDPATGAIG